MLIRKCSIFLLATFHTQDRWQTFKKHCSLIQKTRLLIKSFEINKQVIDLINKSKLNEKYNINNINHSP